LQLSCIGAYPENILVGVGAKFSICLAKAGNNTTRQKLLKKNQNLGGAMVA